LSRCRTTCRKTSWVTSSASASLPSMRRARLYTRVACRAKTWSAGGGEGVTGAIPSSSGEKWGADRCDGPSSNFIVASRKKGGATLPTILREWDVGGARQVQDGANSSG